MEGGSENGDHKRHSEEATTNGSANGKKTKRSSQACIYCQRLKMKCSGNVPCERCIRVGRDCKLPQQAVRQPWSRKKDVEIQTLNRRLQEMEERLNGRRLDTSVGSSSGATTMTQRGFTNASTSETSMGEYYRKDDAQQRLPFIQSNHISREEAKDLFELFMNNCVIHVALMDPEWSSYSRVSKDSTFLFACIIYIASSYHQDRPALQSELRGEMNAMIGKVVTTGEKSTSIVQGFLLLYFFNQPPLHSERDTAWLYSGIAIRIATELNLGSVNKMGKETARERVDRERTWMLTFIVDRSLSTTRGKSWTIRADDSIVRHSSTWCDQNTCRPWDLAISTLADLLKITSRQIDALNSTSSANRDLDETFECETMMRIMNEELEEWRIKWHARGTFNSPWDGQEGTPATEAVNGHQRIEHYLSKQGALRYNYSVLVLNCFGLQYCASYPEKAATARTYVLTQAIRAAQNLVDAAKDGLRYTVTYSPHSQFTIINFGIVSLIKFASLKRDDSMVSQRLIQMAQSGIEFLESVAIQPTHVAARSASFLRNLLRRSLVSSSTFQPGMEVHTLPAQSSRVPSPVPEARPIPPGDLMMQPPPPPQSVYTPIDPALAPLAPPAAYDSQQQPSSLWPFVDDALAILDDTDASNLFGKDGSLGFGALTADELLDDSFWLRIPQRME